MLDEYWWVGLGLEQDGIETGADKRIDDSKYLLKKWMCLQHIARICIARMFYELGVAYRHMSLCHFPESGN